MELLAYLLLPLLTLAVWASVPWFVSYMVGIALLRESRRLRIPSEIIQRYGPELGTKHQVIMDRWIRGFSPWYVRLAARSGELVFVHVFWPLWLGASLEVGARVFHRWIARRARWQKRK